MRQPCWYPGCGAFIADNHQLGMCGAHEANAWRGLNESRRMRGEIGDEAGGRDETRMQARAPENRQEPQ